MGWCHLLKLSPGPASSLLVIFALWNLCLLSAALWEPIATIHELEKSVSCFKCDDTYKWSPPGSDPNNATLCLEADPRRNSVQCSKGCLVWERIFRPEPHGLKGCFDDDIAECLTFVNLLPNRIDTCIESTVNNEELYMMERCLNEPQGIHRRRRRRNVQSPPPSASAKHRHHNHKKPTRKPILDPAEPIDENGDGIYIRDIQMKICWCQSDHCNSINFTRQHFPSVRKYLEEKEKANGTSKLEGITSATIYFTVLTITFLTMNNLY